MIIIFAINELDVVLSLFVSSSAQIQLLTVVIEFLCELVIAPGLQPGEVLGASLGHRNLRLRNRCRLSVEGARLACCFVARLDE